MAWSRPPLFTFLSLQIWGRGIPGRVNTFGREGTYALSLAGGVGYDVMTDRPLVTSTLVGGGGAFGTRGAEPDEVVYRAGVGLTAAPTERVSVEFKYAFDGRSDYQSHGGLAALRWQF